MFPEAALGRVVSLVVVSLGVHGARLAPELGGGADREGEPTSILLPRRETPDETRLGDVLEVFVYQDSEDRPTATRLRPKLALGEVAFLEVRELTAFGAFCDWGLTKELLVPLAEQTHDLARGERIAVGLYVDDSGRLAGTMRVAELLRARPAYRVGDWVEGEAWRSDPAVGVFVILERRSVGLLPASEPNRLRRGEQARFRVTKVHPDGKVELSQRDVAHRQVDDDAERILAVLRDRPGSKVGDRSSPDEIDALFGLSKKAFKRAVGGLYKRGLVEIDEAGFVRLARDR